MSEYFRIFRLRERLKKIRRNKGIASTLTLVIAAVAALIVLQYWNDLATVFVIFGAIGILSALIVIHHYDVEETNVVWKMLQIAKGEYTD